MSGASNSFTRISVPSGATNDLDDRQRDSASFRFDIFCLERVSLTSTFFSGGDWHWTFYAPSGSVLVESASYTSETECLAAIAALRHGAASATISKKQAEPRPALRTQEL